MTNNKSIETNYSQGQAIMLGASLILGFTFLINRFINTFGETFGKSDQLLYLFVFFFGIYHVLTYLLGGYIAASLIKGRELTRAFVAGILNQSLFLFSLLGITQFDTGFFWFIFTMLAAFIGGLSAKIIKSDFAYRNSFFALPIGVFIMSFGLFSGIGNIVMAIIWIARPLFDYNYTDRAFDGILNVGIIFFAAWYFQLAQGFIWHGRRIICAAEAEQKLKRDPRPPILYLRSFKNDYAEYEVAPDRARRPILFGGSATFEELLVKALFKHGPVIAISKPGEYIPPPGAARKNISSNKWQTEVTALMIHSQKILMLVGSTRGLTWEFQKLIELKIVHKVVLVFPQNDQISIWKDFRNKVDCEEVNLPLAIPKKTIFIKFRSSCEYEIISGSFQEKLYSHTISDLFVPRLTS